MTSPLRLRDPDAAFFADWSEWSSLDDLPDAPRNGVGQAIRWGVRGIGPWSRYYCLLRHRTPNQRPGFELCLPPNEPIYRLLGEISIVAKRSSSGRRDVIFVDARDHVALRRVLPALKRAVCAYVRQRR